MKYIFVDESWEDYFNWLRQNGQVDIFVTTSSDSGFVEQPILRIENRNNSATVEVILNKPLQTVEGFGDCFNELGWQALSVLKASACEIILTLKHHQSVQLY